MLKEQCQSEIHGNEHKDKVNPHFWSQLSSVVFFFIIIFSENQNICIFLLWIFSNWQNSCPPLPGFWASRGGWAFHRDVSTWVPPYLSLGWSFVLLAWALVVVAATLARLQGCKMSGRVYLECVKPLSRVLFCFWFSHGLILCSSTFSVADICQTPLEQTELSEFQEKHRDVEGMIVRNQSNFNLEYSGCKSSPTV